MQARRQNQFQALSLYIRVYSFQLSVLRFESFLLFDFLSSILQLFFLLNCFSLTLTLSSDAVNFALFNGVFKLCSEDYRGLDLIVLFLVEGGCLILFLFFWFDLDLLFEVTFPLVLVSCCCIDLMYLVCTFYIFCYSLLTGTILGLLRGYLFICTNSIAPNQYQDHKQDSQSDAYFTNKANYLIILYFMAQNKTILFILVCLETIEYNLSASLNLNSMNQLNQLDPHLQQQLSSLTNANWQTQIEIIQSLPHNLQLIKLINHRNYSSDIASLLAALNPRSKVVTTVVDFIVGIFSLHCNQLCSFANLLVNEDCLLRLLGSGNKVVASAANEALKSIICNTDFKEKHKHIKYVYALQQQFLKSKNNYVREKISLYFQLIVASGYYHTKEALIDFEKKIVKPGLQDACQKVRKNMRKVLENASNFEKQNLIQNLEMEVNSKKNQQAPKLVPKKYIVKGKARVVYSSVNQSSILQSFREEADNIASRSDKQPQSLNNSQINEISYKFYLERLKAGGTWPMVIIAYQEITHCIRKGWLSTLSSDILYFQTFKQLMPFLTEKRSKIYQNCCEVFVILFNNIKESKNNKVLTYLQEISNKLIEYIVKIQPVGVKLLPLLVQLMPWYYVVKIAQVSVELKVNREKLLVLDCLLKCLSSIEDQTKQKSNKKVTSLVKTMCQHIISGNGKDRQINFAALAIISHLKSRYPEDVLTTLLCQSDKVLTKIIEMAESIDTNLKQAVIEYIASFKSQKNYSVSSKASTNCQPHIYQIESQLKLVLQGKTNSLNNLGYLYLTNLNRINQEYFKKLIKILQHLNEKDMLIQLKIILTEVAKEANLPFTKALLSIMEQEEPDMNKQHHILLYIQILGIALKCLNQREHQIQAIVQMIIKVYRKWQSLKIRNMAIQNLTTVEEIILAKFANEKQMELISVYRDHLFHEENDSQQQQEQFLSKQQPRAQVFEADYTQ